MSHETVYAIASGKGGVGKTTTTVNLGTALAGTGKRVVLVDTDLGMANLAGFVSLTPDSTTLHDVLAGTATVDDATYRLAENIDAVPSGTGLEEYAETSPEGLGDVVETLRDRFDVVLLDVGAGVSHETVLPLGLADAVLLVTTPEPSSVQDARKTIELTDRAGGEVAGLLVTRTRPSGDVSYDKIATTLELPLLGTIPDDPAVRESVYKGVPLVVHASESPAAVAYRRLASTLAEDGTDRTTAGDGGQLPTDDAAGSKADDGGRTSAADGGTPDDDTGVTSHDEVSSAITEAESDAT